MDLVFLISKHDFLFKFHSMDTIIPITILLYVRKGLTYCFNNIYSDHSPLCSKCIFFGEKGCNLYHSQGVIGVCTVDGPSNESPDVTSLLIYL